MSDPTDGGHDDLEVEKPRGFARLTPEQRRLLGSKGGRTAHARGTANRFTSEVASRAGKVPHVRGTARHWTTEQAREAGKKGGVAARRKRHQAPEPAPDAGGEGRSPE
jgi:hypothetical protein